MRFVRGRLSPNQKSAPRCGFSLPTITLFCLLLAAPIAAYAQGGSPFYTGTALQALFTGTVAKVASLIAIVIGGYQFAHGEPGAKRVLAGVAGGSGIAVLAANVLTWPWGVQRRRQSLGVYSK